MASEARHPNHLSQQSITNKREFVKIDQATTVTNTLQMVPANPFVLTMGNPWLGLNNLFPGSTSMLIQPQFATTMGHPSLGLNNLINTGSTNMVIQPQTYSMYTKNGLTNSVPNDPRKRSRNAMENQLNNLNIVHHSTNQIQLQGFAAQIFEKNLKSLLETDLILSKYSKKIKMEIAARQKEAPRIMFDGVEAPLMKKLKENEEEILDVGKLNIALEERVKSLMLRTSFWKVLITLGKLGPNDTNQGLPASGGVVADCMNNFGKNEERGGQGRKSVTTAGNGKLARGTEANSRCRMCKKCGERESCVLVLPCKHLCLCTVCSEAINLQDANCPGSNSLIMGMLCVSLT
ncbi:BOI-related E3 ubiquitin-protein ligase 1-like [Apium graveolens]|uniref:BOI-related E3 ubiquitin-protein ligase 1-like n=1 Tax=Apium graveolens TaxID=4045 RepID=UPI003D7AA3BF